MDIDVWWRGLMIGFAIAVPVGPIGLLCIRRTISDGRLAGFVAGLGAATADACYGCVAALGLTAVSSLLLSYNVFLRLIGGLVLCYLGVKTMFTPLTTTTIVASPRLFSAYLTTFGLTISNPATILSFAAIMTAAGVGTGGDPVNAIVFVTEVFCGSALWWLLLSTIAHTLGSRLSADHLRWINWTGGVIVFAFGVAALVSLLS